MMDHGEPSTEELDAWLDGRRDDPELTARIESDAALAARVDELRADRVFLDEMQDLAEPGIRPAVGAPGGLTIAGYEVHEVLGRGGQAVVHRATQASTNRVVALKVLNDGAAAGAGQRRRFMREIELVASLEHPGIVTVHDSGETPDGRLYYAMEMVKGLTVTAHVRRERPTLRERIRLIDDICQAVHHAHLAGVIHRDIKPGNVLVDQTGNVRVLDFGVAAVVGERAAELSRMTEAGQVIGTLAAMSPEQLDGALGRVDSRSDVYALGLLAYEILGGPPAHGDWDAPLDVLLERIRNVDPPRLGTIDAELRGDLETIVARALEKEPDRRYDTAGELSADLWRFLRDEPITAHAPSLAYQARKFARRNRGLVASGGAIAAILLGSTVVSTTFGIKASQANRMSEDVLDAVLDGLADVRDLVPADERMGFELALSRIGERIDESPDQTDAGRRRMHERLVEDWRAEGFWLAAADSSDRLAELAIPGSMDRTRHRLDAASYLFQGQEIDPGALEAAIERLESIRDDRLASIPPTDAIRTELAEQLGVALDFAGRTDEAQAVLSERRAELEPLPASADRSDQLLTVLQAEAFILRGLDRPAEALELMQACLDLTPPRPSAEASILGSMSMLHDDLGQSDRAIEMSRRAVSLMDGTANILRHMQLTTHLQQLNRAGRTDPIDDLLEGPSDRLPAIGSGAWRRRVQAMVARAEIQGDGRPDAALQVLDDALDELLRVVKNSQEPASVPRALLHAQRAGLRARAGARADAERDLVAAESAVATIESSLAGAPPTPLRAVAIQRTRALRAWFEASRGARGWTGPGRTSADFERAVSPFVDPAGDVRDGLRPTRRALIDGILGRPLGPDPMAGDARSGPPGALVSRVSLAAVDAWRAGDRERARDLADAVLELADRLRPRSVESSLSVRRAATIVLAHGPSPAATDALATASDRLQRLLAPDHPWLGADPLTEDIPFFDID